MDKRKGKAIASTLLLLGLASSLAPGLGYAQQSPSPTSGATPAGSGATNALTGGAEGVTTDRATPGARPVNPGSQGSSSGSSSAGNAMTGGAEGSPTDQGTPGRSAVQPPNATGAPVGSGSTTTPPASK
jgi:hypothetical protein